MPGRETSNVFIAQMKPVPSRPMRFSAGTSQSSKINSRVALARMPILFSFLPKLNPGVPFSTMKQLTPRAPRFLSVTANTQYTSASPPFVIHCFVPLSTYLSPFLTAVVRIDPASEPAFGSVSA